MAKKLYLNLLLIALALIGIVDASFITFEKLQGKIPPCMPGFHCASVLESPWASVGPIPLSAIGVCFYLTVFVVSYLLYIDYDFKKIMHNIGDRLKLKPDNLLRFISTQELILALTSFGALFSIYLISIMAFLIGAWCTYCLISAATCAALFITTLFYYSQAGHHSPYLFKSMVSGLAHLKYKYILRPLFFRLDSETIHNILVTSGRLFASNPVGQYLLKVTFGFSHPSLAVKLAGLTFPNRVGLSAGFDYDGDLVNAVPALGFGWHTIGTVTFQPYTGNPKPRLGRFPKSRALLVNKGLKSLGAATVINKLSAYRFQVPTAISIASTNQAYKSDQSQLQDILSCFKLFEKSSLKHHLYEMNISCPNTFGGEPYTSPRRLESLLKALDQLKIKRPILLKMPIDQSESETLELLKVADKHNVAGVIFGNLTKNKTNPAVTKSDQTAWQNKKGNLSGKPTFDLSNKLIALTKKYFKNRFVIVGTGGIFSPDDALMKIKLGADLLQLITGMVYEGPQLIGQINHKLSREKLA